MTSQLNTTPSSPHGEQQFKPNTTVAAVIHCQGKFLLVEEIEHDQRVFNQPAGHIEAGESLLAACQREVLEETGLTLSPDYISGIYYFHRPDLSLYFLRFCFVIELDECLTATPQDDEIIACHWLTLAQIQQRKKQLRSAMVLDCIDDYLAINDVNNQSKQKIPLEMIATNL